MTAASLIGQRVKWLFAIFLFLGALIVWRFAYLQILNHPAVSRQRTASGLFSSSLPKGRGEIFLTDRFGDLSPLAVNRNVFTVYIEPNHVSDQDGVVRALSDIFSISEDELRQKVSKPNDPYEVIASRITDDVATRVKNLHLAGVGMSSEMGRYYPLETLAAHVSGFLGISGDKRTGQYGIEGFYEDELTSENGSIDKLILSIDPHVQFKLEGVLKGAIEKWKASGGSAIVMEPSTGRILAIADYPTFNPNGYFQEKDISVFSDSAISGQYELGSVFKPITMATALNEGKVTPDTTYDDKGAVLINGYTIRDFDGKAHGITTMTQVLEKSLNLGAMFAQQQLPKDVFRTYVENFGFGQKTGVDLQGEVAGNINNLNRDKDLEFANASFGQGISVTSLQMLTAISAIANGGTLMTPHLVDKKIYRDGSVELVAPLPVRRVISGDTAATLTKMLVSVVENGYDKAKVPGYFIAGKTGTAQIPSPDKRGYSDQVIHSFVGYAPAYHPRFAVLIKMDKPQGVNFASSSLAPTFSDIMSYLLTYYEVPPDIKE